MSQEGKTPTPQTPPATAPAAPKPAAPLPVKPSATPPASPNLPPERNYIDVKVGDFVEFKVRKPDGEIWRVGKVTSLNRDFTDIMPLESETIYCTHKEFIRRVLSKDEVAALPPAANWYLERH